MSDNAPTRKSIPQAEVLAWVQKNYPALHAEPERDWIWLACDLRKDETTRKAIKDYGFVFSKFGHKLPSGRMGTWAHHCQKPLPFKRHKGQAKGQGQFLARQNKPATTAPAPKSERVDPMELASEVSDLEKEALAFLNE